MEKLERIVDNEENKVLDKSSLGDYTRKSVVGAVYRVGASFTIDAIYLTAIGALGYYLEHGSEVGNSLIKSTSDFVHNLDPAKLMRVAGAVVLINFVDYKLDVTNKLDNLAKKAQKVLSKSLGRKE